MAWINLFRRRRQRDSIVLVLAMLPMLTFMGHWPEAVAIPGTSQYLAVPLAGHPVESDEAHEHAQHCHGDSATCTDAPVTIGVGFALNSEALALAVSSGLLLLLALQWWQPLSSAAVVPELQPPRTILGRV